MHQIKFDFSFVLDYQRVVRRHPWIRHEFATALRELAENGELPESCGAHVLDNPGGNYNGHIDFHLSDRVVDVIVLYLPHRSNPVIRLVRMGSHDELFRGSQ